MKTFVILAVLAAVALAGKAPIQRRQAEQQLQQQHEDVVVVKETPLDNIGVDGYNFGYELSDGSARQESAQVEVRGEEDAVLRVQGSFRYFNPEDQQYYEVSYIADENGFQPQGAHLPVAPQ